MEEFDDEDIDNFVDEIINSIKGVDRGSTLIDILSEEGSIKVVLEIFGFEKEDFEFNINKSGNLEIKASRNDKTISETISVRVDEEMISNIDHTYNTGILTVVLEKE